SPLATSVPGEARAVPVQNMTRTVAAAQARAQDFHESGRPMLLLGECRDRKFIFVFLFLEVVSCSPLAAFPIAEKAGAGKQLSYWRKSVTPEVAEPPALEVTVTTLGASMFVKVTE